MKIRKLKTGDYDELVGLWRRAGLEFRPAGRDSRESIAKQIEKFGDLMVVAEKDGQMAGAAIGSHDHRKGWINRVAVSPEWRRKGVAKALVNRLEEEFGKLGIKVMCILIKDDNESSISLFEGLDYSNLDKVKYYSKRPGWDV